MRRHLIVALASTLTTQVQAQTVVVDSALEQRLAAAELNFTFPSRIRGATSAPRWLTESDRFLYRFTASGVGRWAIVDAGGNGVQFLFTEREMPPEMMQAVSFANLRTPWRFVRDNAGGFRISLPGGTAVFASLPATTVARWLPDDARPSLKVVGGKLVGVDAQGDTVLIRAAEADQSWEIPSDCWSAARNACVVVLSDARAVHRLPIVDYSHPLERVSTAPYPKAGTPIAATGVYIFHPTTRALSLVLTDSTAYYWFAGWRPRSSEFLVLRLDRPAKRLELLAIDQASGRRRVITREESAGTSVAGLEFSWENANQVLPLADGERFLWLSERDGWRHVYLYRFDGAAERQVTRGPFPVRRVLHIDERRGEILVLAAGDSTRLYDTRVYRANLNGTAWRELTPEPGVHSAWASPNGEYLVDTWSSVMAPARSVLRRRDGRIVRALEQADTSGLGATGYQTPESATVLAADDSTRLAAVLYRPTNFDPQNKYPVIDLIYGGPPFNAVPHTFGGSIFSPEASSLAQVGFVVVIIDARGTPGRSKGFRDAIYGRVGEIEIRDHVAALRRLAATRPYLDTTRIGITGYSWGGYYALHAMLTAPSVFRAGYAGAPGDFTSDAFINEPHLGLPSQAPQGYARGDNTALASNLVGALKIMHGTADTNAPFSNTMRMVDALVRAGKRFELLVLPGENHGLSPQKRAYYRDDVRRFFARHLGSPL